jgi:hypothetical protein
MEEESTENQMPDHRPRHRVTSYKWKENVKQDFIDCLNANVSLLYGYGIQFCLENSRVEERVLYPVVSRAGTEMEHSGKSSSIGMMRNVKG